ncbi:proline iminopeptidase-family hydrolase [Marivirga sp. S37H4]|uniref:Proline iminopeptidase-family hydrolase n=2 Tax=Marivirga aurantiaca TaxID=2802615 RepID=A0A935C7Y0_9BACT|nr:proline iminopeptidase-family hydrolase [Marivirga aurantiaca]
MNHLKNLTLLSVFLLCISCQSNPSLQAEEGYVEVEGGKIWYKVIGEGDQVPLLLMHGGPGGTHCYFYELTPLSENRPIILFDQLGSGRSDHHTDTALLKVDKFVEQVRELKSHLNLKEYYLLGHSWGAALELEYYQKYPEGVKGIIFSSPYVSTPVWAADADTLISSLPDSVQSLIAQAEESGNYNTKEYKYADSIYWANFGLRTDYGGHEWDTIPAPSNKFIYNNMWGPSEFTATGILKSYDNKEALKEVKVPVLFVTGEYDEARPQTVKHFQSLVPNSEFKVIEGAGHATMKDNSSQYNQAIHQFLQEVEK